MPGRLPACRPSRGCDKPGATIGWAILARSVLCLLLAVIAGCADSNPPMDNSRASAIRYLALGDSYTIGESVAESERWPNQLASVLRQSGKNVADPTIIARTGWTTDELSKAIDDAAPAASWDLVSLLIGVNNQYRGRDAEQYRKEFVVLLRRAIQLARGNAGRVVVVSIPDWGVTPFAKDRDRAKIAREIDLYNAINREESQRLGVIYVDITPVSREPDPDLVAGDGLHPSGKQYAAWTRLIAAKIPPMQMGTP